MNQKVTICGVDTSSLPKYNNAQSNEMLKKIKEGDKLTREAFIMGNMRLVLSIVKRFSNGKNNSDDLFQAGCVGLIKAIDNFDVTVGVMFSTYAVPMIIGEIRKYIRETNALKLSRRVRDIAYKTLYTREAMIRQGTEPTICEIAKEIDIPLRDVEDAMDAISDPVSIYDYIFNDDGDKMEMREQLYDKKCNEDSWIENVSLKDSLELIPERERTILILRYYQGRTQTEISEIVRISQAQVSRLEKDALQKLRDMIS